jgi:HAMP domain-containing protein
VDTYCGYFGIYELSILSKHLHILLAFSNTYFANLNVQGQFDNLESVTKEVKLMMDPNADPLQQSTIE